MYIHMPKAKKGEKLQILIQITKKLSVYVCTYIYLYIQLHTRISQPEDGCVEVTVLKLSITLNINVALHFVE